MQRTEVFRNPIAPLAVRLTRCIVLTAALALLAGAAAFAQVPNSGALLTITGTANGPVNIQVYDSQIHGGVVRTPPVSIGGNCLASDQIPTDAYVLQGGAPTGCDTGDDYEITDSSNENTHQVSGKTTIGGFQIETDYHCGGTCTDVTEPGPVCNTAGTICANPDNGFVTVTNTTGYNFTGTISLTGNSPLCGAASDSVAYTEEPLGPGGQVILALGTQGTVENPSQVDSSNCGGYNAPQKQNLVAGSTNTFLFGNDAYKITPANSNPGDTLTFIPVPVPAGPLGPSFSWITGDFGMQAAENPVAASPLRFSATNFPGQACIPFSDFSALTNPVCPEIQLDCASTNEVANDCGTFLYTAELDFTIDKNSLPNGVGGVAFLGDHNAECPDTAFNINIFLSYTATAPDPVRGTSNGNSCFAATFDPTAKPVATGKTVTQETLNGFLPPVVDSSSNHIFFNKVEAGATVPLIWQTENSSDKPVTNLTLCANTTGTGCTTPWVNVESEAVNCVTGVPSGTPMVDMSLLKTGLLNLGGGFYTFLWKTPKNAAGTCATPVLTFSTGFVSYSVANFKFAP